MSTRTDPKTELYQWLARWELLARWEEGAPLTELPLSDDFDAFVKDPSGEGLHNLVISLKARSQGSRFLAGRSGRRHSRKGKGSGAVGALERIVDYLWLVHRAEKIGISLGDSAPPEVFYLLNTASRRSLSLLAPAPADVADIPFRAGMARALFGFIQGGGKKGHEDSFPPEKVVVVFTQVGSELRRAVVPQLVSRLHERGTPYLYLRVAPHASSRWDVEPVDHRDLLKRSVGAIRKGSILNESAGGGVLVLDFLDSYDVLHEGPGKWLPSYKRLIDAINSSFIRREGSHLLIFLNGEPSSYRKSWLGFSPFFTQLDIDQPNVAGLGMVPQLMNERQGAALMGFGPENMRLLASRVPLIFGSLEEMRERIDMFGYDAADDRAILKAIERMPGSKMVVASDKDGFSRASHAERKMAPDAVRPRRGHFHFVISHDGDVGFVEEAELADMMVHSSASGVSPAEDDGEDEDFDVVDEPIEAEPAVAEPVLKEKQFDQKVTKSMARMIYKSSRTLRSIRFAQRKSPSVLIETLEEHGTEIAAELCAAKGSPTHGYTSFNYLTLTKAVIAGVRIKRNADDFERWASARDLYGASPLLRGMRKDEIWPPRVLLENLVSLKPRIVREQRALGGKDLSSADFSMYDLVIALASAGRIDTRHLEKMGSMFKVYDMIDRSPTLLAIPKEALLSDKGIVRYLLIHRDRIAVEVQKSQGQLRPDEFIFEGAESYFRLGGLLGVLFAAGVIDKATRNRLSSTASGPIEYFLDNKEMVASELKRLGKGKIRGQNIDLSKFKHPSKPGMILPRPYVSHVLRWGEWFLNDPDVATRSIYRADEIAFMVLAGAGDVFDDAPREILLKIEDAGWDAATVSVTARKQSLTALYDLLDFYEQREIEGEPVREETRQALEKVDRIYMWNRDAIAGRGKGGAKGGQGPKAAKRPPSGTSGPDLSGTLAIDGAGPSAQMAMGAGAFMMAGAAAHAAMF